MQQIGCSQGKLVVVGRMAAKRYPHQLTGADAMQCNAAAGNIAQPENAVKGHTPSPHAWH
jgi:hypothetical protein